MLLMMIMVTDADAVLLLRGDYFRCPIKQPSRNLRVQNRGCTSCEPKQASGNPRTTGTSMIPNVMVRYT